MPNPRSVIQLDYEKYFRFIGRILGKDTFLPQSRKDTKFFKTKKTQMNVSFLIFEP